MPSIRNEWNYVDINFPFIFVKFFGFLSARLHVVCTFTSKMANLWNNKKAILDIIDNSESDAESIFSGDSSNYDPDIEVKLKMKILMILTRRTTMKKVMIQMTACLLQMDGVNTDRNQIS